MMGDKKQRRSGYGERRKYKNSKYLESELRRREELYRRVIYRGIQGQSCPICLKSLEQEIRKVAVISGCLHAYCEGCIRRWSHFKHRCPLCNTQFDSWFHRFSLSSPATFLLFKLPQTNPPPQPMIRDEVRLEVTRMRTRSRPLPWRRTFRGTVANDHAIAQRKLQWRASVYERGLRAVPLSSRKFLRQNMSNDGSNKERILQRIEPWIRRELQAILKDPDPSIIAHVASSLFISSLGVQSGGSRDEDDFLTPLRHFLLDWTDTFWHELRCFAENSLTMETYDAVVEYA